MEVPRLGLHLSCSCQPTAHGNVGSLTHWARPGIEPTSSWMLVSFVSTEPRWERLYPFLKLHPGCLYKEDKFQKESGCRKVEKHIRRPNIVQRRWYSGEHRCLSEPLTSHWPGSKPDPQGRETSTEFYATLYPPSARVTMRIWIHEVNLQHCRGERSHDTEEREVPGRTGWLGLELPKRLGRTRVSPAWLSSEE